MKRQCLTCGKIFYKFLSAIKHGEGKFCSQKCQTIARIGKKLSKKTRKKMSKSHRNEKHPNWKGGISIRGGYCYIKNPNHARNYVKKARLIMEQKLMRPLLITEIVHHINGIKMDDRPENLELFVNKSKHICSHWENPLYRKHMSDKHMGHPYYPHK